MSQVAPVAAPPPTLSCRSVLIILAFGGTLLGMGLGGRIRVLTYHEVLFAEPAREMLASGDWVIPRILGVPDTHKPPLTCWLIALSMKVFGQDSEWVVRLPAVMSALATALLVAFMTARWFGDRAGLLAGLMHLSMYYTLMLSRLAEVDGILVMTVCAAMTVFALAHVDSPRGRCAYRWLPWAFYLAVVLSFLAKGLIGPGFIFSGAGLFLLIQRDWGAWRFFSNPIGLVIFIAGTLAWPMAAYCTYPQFLQDQLAHHFGRFSGSMGQSEPIYAYVYAVPLCTLPWTPLVLAGAAAGRRQGWLTAPLGRFFVCWMLPGLILLTASAWRHKHYAAPLLPPLSSMAAIGFLAYGDYRKRRRAGRLVPGLVALLAGSGVAAALVFLMRPRGYEPIACLVAVAGLLLSLVFYFDHRRRQVAQSVALFLTIWVLAAGTFTWVMPYHDSYRQQTQFADTANAVRPDGANLYLVAVPENQISYYLKQPLTRIDEPGELTRRIPSHAAIYVITPECALPVLTRVGRIEVLGRYARTRLPEDQLTLARFQAD